MKKQLLLQLQNICYSYEEASVALQNISVSIFSGEKIAVLGSNGAGKSTFFLTCNGVIRPSTGTISYRGQEILHKKQDLKQLRRNVGIVFQEPDQQLIAPTVESEISFGPMNLRLSTEEVRRRVDAAICAMNLEDMRRRQPHNLSGGEKKRLTIADVLAMQPEILLFDEPSAFLDPSNTQLLESTLHQLSDSGMTLLISTHDIDFVWRWAERVLVLHQGEIILDSTPADLFSRNDIIQSVGLCKPILFEVMEAMTTENPQSTGHLPVEQWAKTVEQFRTFIQNKR